MAAVDVHFNVLKPLHHSIGKRRRPSATTGKSQHDGDVIIAVMGFIATGHRQLFVSFCQGFIQVPGLMGTTGLDIEVLILDDEIDEIIMPSIPNYKEKDLKSVNRSGAADDLKKESDKDKAKAIKPLIKKIKSVLGDKVKDVKASNRLSDSPSCIVADENDPTAQMQEIMRATGQVGMPEVKPILEINPDHEIVKKLITMRKSKSFDDSALLLYEQALLQEGVKLDNPAGFVKRLNKLMEKAL